MAITRKALAAMGIEEAQVDEIIKMHTDTVNEIKDERDTYKADAAKLDAVQKELDALKEEAKQGDRSPYKAKYEALKEEKDALQKEYDDYKADQDSKALTAKKKEAYKKLLIDAGVSEKRIEAVLKVTDLNDIELDEKDGIKDADKKTESIKEEWSDFIVSTQTKGAETSTPPSNNGGTMSQPSAAAQRAQRYYANLYGEAKKED